MVSISLADFFCHWKIISLRNNLKEEAGWSSCLKLGIICSKPTWVSQHAQNLLKILHYRIFMPKNWRNLHHWKWQISPESPNMHKICLAFFLVQLLLHQHHHRQQDQQQKVLKFQLESSWRLQLGHTTAYWGLQEKLWKWWFCHWSLLSGGKYPSFENQICKFYVFLYDYSLRPFLVWVSKDLLYCLSTRATNPNNFLPFHNDLKSDWSNINHMFWMIDADCRVSKLMIFNSCSP